jgi:hypothetical protein
METAPIRAVFLRLLRWLYHLADAPVHRLGDLFLGVTQQFLGMLKVSLAGRLGSDVAERLCCANV